MNKIYVVEVKNYHTDLFYPQETYLGRAAADHSVAKKKEFMKLNKIKGVFARVKVYVPLKRPANA